MWRFLHKKLSVAAHCIYATWFGQLLIIDLVGLLSVQYAHKWDHKLKKVSTLTKAKNYELNKMLSNLEMQENAFRRF